MEKFNSATVEVHTPIGNLFATFLEKDKICVRVILHIGKSGTDTRAWSESLASIINKMLERHIHLVEIADSISAYTTDRSAYNTTRNVRSGPDGVVYAIHSYLRSINNKVRSNILHQPWLY